MLLRRRDLEIELLQEQIWDLQYEKMVNSNYYNDKNTKNLERESKNTHKYKTKLEKFQG